MQSICFTLEHYCAICFWKPFRSTYWISLTCHYGLRIGVLVGASEDSKGCPFMIFPLGYEGFFQYTCYDSSYITQCTELVRIFPTNANGWCCHNIDLRLVFSGLPSRPASAHAILGCRSESSLAASLVSKTPATALNTVPWFGIVDKFRAWLKV